jgi:CIC family chloride channel protein
MKNAYNNLHSLLKWVAISICIGLAGGGGAIAFYLAIRLTTSLFLGNIIGYIPPSVAGEGSAHLFPFWGTARPWLLPLVTALGGLLSGVILNWLAPEAEKGGQDTAIRAFHESKPIRARVFLIKLVASALVIGTGGSAGREGPIAHIGASLGSVLGRIFHLNAREQRQALIAGMAAGIGAIFRAPLGGAILAVEILYQEGLAGESLLPALLSSTVGYGIYGLYFGWRPLFLIQSNLALNTPLSLLSFVPLGLLSGFLGKLYAFTFQHIGIFFQRLPLPRWSKPAAGGLLVGLIGLALPQILSTSFGWIQISMGAGLLTLPLWVLLLFPFVKMLTTAFSIESGGSGGIFGPGMVIGGMGGALLWRLSSAFIPGLPVSPIPFVIVGMMACLGSIGHVPIAALLMVSEMTGAFSLFPPAIIAVSLACLVVGKQTLYTSQRGTRTNDKVG